MGMHLMMEIHLMMKIPSDNGDAFDDEDTI
jgi:hypothetical protein